MSSTYFENANIADSAPDAAITPETRMLAMNGNQQVAIGEELNWVAIPAYSSNWTSAAFVAYITPNIIMMKGKFTSTADTNADPFGRFPDGYKGELNTVTYSTITDNVSTSLGAITASGAYGIFGTTPEASTGEEVSVENIMYVAATSQTPNTYQSGFTYIIGEKCVSVGITYVSLQNANLNYTPASSPTWWSVVA